MYINNINNQLNGLGGWFSDMPKQTPQDFLNMKIQAVTEYEKDETKQQMLMKQYGHLDVVPFRDALFKIYGMPKNVAYVPNWSKPPVVPAQQPVLLPMVSITNEPVKPAITLPTFTPIPNTAPVTTTAPTAPPKPTEAELLAQKKKEDQKKMLMYGGIGLGVLVLGGIIWYAAAK